MLRPVGIYGLLHVARDGDEHDISECEDRRCPKDPVFKDVTDGIPRSVLPQPFEADAYTYLVDVMGMAKKQIIIANSLDEARTKAKQKYGIIRHVQVQTPLDRQPEPTLTRTKVSPRYSNHGKELLSPKVFREHMAKLINEYCLESHHDDGPGWAGKFGKVEDIALDFCEFVTALEGDVK